MAQRNVFHVVPTANSWKVTRVGQDDLEVLRDNKDDAVDDARNLAQSEMPSQVVVHTRDGKIETEYTYGDDPTSSPG